MSKHEDIKHLILHVNVHNIVLNVTIIITCIFNGNKQRDEKMFTMKISLTG